jgi:transcription termination/antitermination protein NusA
MTGTPPRPASEASLAAADLRAAVLQLVEAGHGTTEEVVGLVERAVSSAHSRLLPDAPPVQARLDLDSGVLSLFRRGPDGELEAVDDLPADFARQAAQAAKGAVAGWLREAERDRVIGEVSARRGELVDVIVERSQPAGAATGQQLWEVRADRFGAILPPEEQIPGEVLVRGQHLKVVVVDIRRRVRDAVAVVSRSHPQLLRRLLEQEVPELASGQVAIRAMAREPGRRSKVAVHAPTAQVDPEGACIGPHGVRIRAVVAELGEEQVQVVAWSTDPAAFVAAALGPAEVLGVDLDEDTRTAHVRVPAAQLSLAIGRAGENARLAARLTGWRIDIHPDQPEAAVR